MNKKVLVSLMIFVICIMGVKAEEDLSKNITISKLSEHVSTIFSSNRVEIDFIDEEDNSFIEGATLKIVDEKEKPIIKWVSYDETTVIEGLEKGTYYLMEAEPKEGYAKTKDKIKFEVNDEVVMLELSTVKKIENPNVISSTSILMIFFAMFDLVLGIGMLIYAKKANN